MVAERSTSTHNCSSRISEERRRLPLIIQGGLGVAVSNWRLARAVSALGQLGVVSGTAIDQVVVRRSQCAETYTNR